MVESSGERDIIRGILCVTAMVACSAGVVQAGETPPIGTKAGQMYPDFLLPKLDGDFGRLSDYRGKKVLLVHFASW